ncbi:MAG: CehA/McbA family metallohydrolase [Planctomycetes bacterium]|nr:CehA/McbA family metallohydrolase [Planctomycetota bacterium]
MLLEPRLLDQGLLGVEVKGRALEPGEIIRFAYGAGSAGAMADRYAERGSRFWIAVDGDGDGVRAVLEASPALDVLPGPAARLVLTLQSTARRGEVVPLVVAVLDAAGSACTDFEGEIELSTATGGLAVPEKLSMEAAHQGARAIEVLAPRPGVFRVIGRLRGAGGAVEIAAISNPLAVDQGWPRILWGDLHGHSNCSDGTGLPEDYYRYARDVAALDFAALTDHDHYGILFLDQHQAMWDEIRAAALRFHQPGRFVALLGYEWTSWIHGHRHVVFFQDNGRVLSSLDPAFRTPAQLWEGLRGQQALTFAHHSAGGPIATNWSYRPDPDIEPITEVTSVHGSSEALDSPNLIYRPMRGNTVRAALDHGLRFGFVGSGDSHDGHPGLAHLTAPSGGLAAVFAEECTREGILEALKARRAYATNGARILLDVRLGGRLMGSTIALGEEPAPRELTVRAIGTGPLAGIEVIRSGAVVEAKAIEDALEIETTFHLEGLARGEYVYVRVTQFDLEEPRRVFLAWSSPIFLD